MINIAATVHDYRTFKHRAIVQRQAMLGNKLECTSVAMGLKFTCVEVTQISKTQLQILNASLVMQYFLASNTFDQPKYSCAPHLGNILANIICNICALVSCQLQDSPIVSRLGGQSGAVPHHCLCPRTSGRPFKSTPPCTRILGVDYVLILDSQHSDEPQVGAECKRYMVCITILLSYFSPKTGFICRPPLQES